MRRPLQLSLLSAAAGVLISALAPGAASAEEPLPAFPPLKSDEIPFSPDEWRALSDGKTLFYLEWGRFTGRERYFAGSDRVVFQRTEDNGCSDGVYAFREAPEAAGGGLYCFYWDERVCFQHFKRGDQIIARRVDGSEAVIFRINEEPVTCSDEVS